MDPASTARQRRRSREVGSCTPGAPGCSLQVATEPYHPAYFMINGRSMPDDMDPNYAAQYPHQPYNGNPHMHPGELTLLRVIGQGRWQHPVPRARQPRAHPGARRQPDSEQSANPARRQALAGPLLFTPRPPGQAMDGIFHCTGKGLNWDMYGHNPTSSDPHAKLPCTPDANGYNTGELRPRSTTTSGARTTTSRWRQALRRRRQRRPGDPARSEHLRERRLVRRQPLPRSGRDRPRGRRHGTIPPSGTVANIPTARRASPSCGTRTTSARSPPTTFFRAE